MPSGPGCASPRSATVRHSSLSQVQQSLTIGPQISLFIRSARHLPMHLHRRNRKVASKPRGDGAAASIKAARGQGEVGNLYLQRERRTGQAFPEARIVVITSITPRISSTRGISRRGTWPGWGGLRSPMACGGRHYGVTRSSSMAACTQRRGLRTATSSRLKLGLDDGDMGCCGGRGKLRCMLGMSGRDPARARSPRWVRGQYITALPASNLVVVHKVNIHQDPHRNVSEPAYMTILDIVLDAKCDKNCKQGSLLLR